MHISKAKTIATLAILAAVAIICLMIGTFIPINTLCFTAIAAFLVGIVVIRYGIKYAVVYFAVCATLDFILNPNKITVLLYIGLAAYILLSEISWLLMKKYPTTPKKVLIQRGIRFLIFLAIYIPMVIYIPHLLVAKKILESQFFIIIMCAFGLGGWLVFDMAYVAAKRMIYQKFGKTL